MKHAILFLLALSTSALYAADCTVTVGGESVVVKENEPVSLRASNGPLSKAIVQDQDGLGSCYANAASSVLQSMLPGNPEISYTHAGVKGASHGKRVDWSKGGTYMKKGKEEFIDGGYVCETIDAMKKSGGACPKHFSLLENSELPISEVQKEMFDGVGRYFDFVNSIKKDPTKMEQLRTDLTHVVGRLKESIRVKKDGIKRYCEADMAQKYPIHVSLNDQLSGIYLRAGSEGACGKAKKAAIQELLSDASIIKSDKVRFQFKPEVLQAFTEDFDANPEFSADLEAHAKGSLPADKTQALEASMSKHVEDVLKKLVPADKLKDCKSAAHPLMDKNYPTGTMFLSRIQGMRGVKCDEIMPADFWDEIFADVRKEKCAAPKTLESILGALTPLLEANKVVFEDLVETMLNPTSAFANQIEKLLMPGCMDKKNLIPMDDMSCTSHAMCDRIAEEKKVDNVSYTGKKGKCHTKAEGKAIFHDQVLTGIKEGRALAVGICTGFLNPKHLGADSNFCQKKIKGIDGHGDHEFTISGYRCVGGKIEYEILNSWGSKCPTVTEENEVYKDKHFECQLDAKNQPTGVFWVKEDTLVSNALEVTAVKKKP